MARTVEVPVRVRVEVEVEVRTRIGDEEWISLGPGAVEGTDRVEISDQIAEGLRELATEIQKRGRKPVPDDG